MEYDGVTVTSVATITTGIDGEYDGVTVTSGATITTGIDGERRLSLESNCDALDDCDCEAPS